MSGEPLPAWLDAIGDEASAALESDANETCAAHFQPDLLHASCSSPGEQPEGKVLSSKELSDLKTLTVKAFFVP